MHDLFTATLPHLARPASRCGIHGNDTTSGRCPSCEEDAMPPTPAELVADLRFVNDSTRLEELGGGVVAVVVDHQHDACLSITPAQVDGADWTVAHYSTTAWEQGDDPTIVVDLTDGEIVQYVHHVTHGS